LIPSLLRAVISSRGRWARSTPAWPRPTRKMAERSPGTRLSLPT